MLPLYFGSFDFTKWGHRATSPFPLASYYGFSLDVGPSGVPIMSPETTISTRRLSCRPAGVSLEATGWLSPKPRAVIDDGVTPCWIRKSRTALARSSDNI